MSKLTYTRKSLKDLCKDPIAKWLLVVLLTTIITVLIVILYKADDFVSIEEFILPEFTHITTSITIGLATVIIIKALSTSIFDKSIDFDKTTNSSKLIDFDNIEKLNKKAHKIHAADRITHNYEQLNSQKQEPERIQKDSITTIIDDCICESSEISERIYNNSKTYLFVGLAVAILGVSFFIIYGFTNDNNNQNKELLERALDFLPRVGALFFIEFIAFFFLKQYRILLEEYRYYESIKRDRQHKKLIIEIVDKYKDNPEILKLIINYMDNHSIKIPEITGDHKIESEKALYKDMDILDKFVEFSKIIKK